MKIAEDKVQFPLEELNRGRQIIYQMFAHLFLGEWKQWERELAVVAEEIQWFKTLASKYDDEQVPFIFEQRFMVPGPYYIPPYASYHRRQSAQREGVSQGSLHEVTKQELLSLLELYEQMKFYLPVERGEQPDHLSMQFRFIQSLIASEEEGYETGDREYLRQIYQIEVRFIEQYLQSWLPRFCEKLLAAESHPFVQQIAAFIPSFIEEDYKELRQNLA
ncbi:TorD/DmsD family molecular chaperone [Rubeoparvulum massiliense]|uniref:TorD/DmsD family molecular chaperone n=1 Tax=Rubeoparvulum massiliense TaxID=1631346 RepID=UPI00065E2571|nr:molecular chaperone TorD family protein [Rubeoparvulum massiliense]